MLDTKKLIAKILEWIQGANRYYSAAWTATSSAAVGTTLTGTMTLPKGTYLITATSPYVNTSNLTIALRIAGTTNVSTTCTFRSGGYTNATFIVQLTSQSAVLALSQSSASVSLTNTDRGGLKAVRVCG